MLFTAKVVKENKEANYFMYTAVVCFVLAITGLLLHIIIIMRFAVVVIILAGIFNNLFNKKGKTLYDLSNEFIVLEDRFEINTIIFPFSEISLVKFCFESYQIGEIRNDIKRGNYTQDGFGNTISFKYKNQQYLYNFWLQSREHYELFVYMLAELYKLNLAFTEENAHGKTYLMQHVVD
jgi:hypothetical protein